MTENKRFELVAFLDNVWGVYDTTEQIIDENSSFSWIWKEMVVDLLNEQDQQIKKTKEVLQKHYDYAYNQRQKNLDNAIVAEAYNVLRVTVADIADELGIEIKK